MDASMNRIESLMLEIIDFLKSRTRLPPPATSLAAKPLPPTTTTPPAVSVTATAPASAFAPPLVTSPLSSTASPQLQTHPLSHIPPPPTLPTPPQKHINTKVTTKTIAMLPTEISKPYVIITTTPLLGLVPNGPKKPVVLPLQPFPCKGLQANANEDLCYQHPKTCHTIRASCHTLLEAAPKKHWLSPKTSATPARVIFPCQNTTSALPLMNRNTSSNGRREWRPPWRNRPVLEDKDVLSGGELIRASCHTLLKGVH